MDRFTTPPPYGNLYDAETPPSAQPRTPPFDINEFIDFPPSSPLPIPPSQQTTQDVPPSQQTTQSWDSRNGPRPSSLHSTPSTPPPIPESLLESGPNPPPFVRDSQASSSQSSRPRSLRPRKYGLHVECSRDTRLQIQTALLFRVPIPKIKETLDVTDGQILYAKNHRPTPQKCRTGRHPKLHTPQKKILEEWLHNSPSHRHIKFSRIPYYLPELAAKEQAIRTAYKWLGYGRRIARKKGFSEDPKVIKKRLTFAEDAVRWPRDRVQRVAFSDEVWAFGGAHTSAYVTMKEDGRVNPPFLTVQFTNKCRSERLLPEIVRHKYRKLPAWMFWGIIIDGKKGPSCFWEKGWGTENSERYDRHILSIVQQFFQDHPLSRYRFWQDGAPSHRSYETKTYMLDRHIPTIEVPPYSPDLNLIEHVWNWMKNWIENHYWHVRYNPEKLPLRQLRRIIRDAWDAVPDEYIQGLFDSWWRRCQAVIDARGGPTKY
jgi:DDE superfamily endonuclease